MLNHIEVHNFKRILDELGIDESIYRNLKNEEKYELDNNFVKRKPCKLNNLSSINYVIGSNGSGKSSLLNALWLFSTKKEIEYRGIDKPSFLDNSIIQVFSNSIFPSITKVILDNKEFNYASKHYNPLINKTLLLWCTKNHPSRLNHKDPITAIKNRSRSFANQHLLEYYNYESIYSQWNLIFMDSGLQDFHNYVGQNLNEESWYQNFEDEWSEIRRFRNQRSHSSGGNGFWCDEATGEATLNTLPILFSFLMKTDYELILIEEPEVNLHPKYQKLIPELFKLIQKHLKNNNRFVQFIISTHSPFIINSAIALDKPAYKSHLEKGLDKEDFSPTNKIYHLEDGKNKNLSGDGITIKNFETGYNSVLGSIGVQPSDLLFANGVIWVEGPSDAIYIETWLEMYARSLRLKTFKPGLDFQFQMYAGALLQHYIQNGEAYKGDLFKKEITEFKKINPHYFWVFDYDDQHSSFEEAKLEIISQIDNEKYWYDNNVKTIEYYTPEKSKTDWWQNQGSKHYTEHLETNRIMKKDWSGKTDYAYRCKYLWNKQIDEHGSDCWEKYLVTLSDNAKRGLEKYIPQLYEAIANWNQNT
jgi:predicted ATP-dependent endonuclease of OLD family